MTDSIEDPIETPSGAAPPSEAVPSSGPLPTAASTDSDGFDRELSARLAVDAPDPGLAARHVRRALRAYDEAAPPTALTGRSGTVVSIDDRHRNRSRRVLAIVATAAAAIVIGGVGVNAITGGPDATDDEMSTASGSPSDDAGPGDRSAEKSGASSLPGADIDSPLVDAAAREDVAGAAPAAGVSGASVEVIDLGSFDDLEALRRAPLGGAADRNVGFEQGVGAAGSLVPGAGVDVCVGSLPAGLAPTYRAVVGGAEVLLVGVVDPEGNDGSLPVDLESTGPASTDDRTVTGGTVGSAGLGLLTVSDCTVRPL